MDFEDFSANQQITLVNLLYDFATSVSLADGVGSEEEIKKIALLKSIEYKSKILNGVLSLTKEMQGKINFEYIAINASTIRSESREILRLLPEEDLQNFYTGLLVIAYNIAESDGNVTAQEAGLVCDYMEEIGYSNRNVVLTFFLDS
jgi:tellurite resistance protein